jgi:hypothetical protein
VDDSVMMISKGYQEKEIWKLGGVGNKGSLILSEGGHKHCGVYRGVLGLMSRFGYVSVREVMYGFQLNLDSALHRLSYLEKIKLIQWFPSLTIPVTFYCLTSQGRQAVRRFNVSDDLTHFIPSQYQPIAQEHHRAIIRVYLALQRLLGPRFLGWTTEQRLKAEGGINKEKRILDGELFLNVRKTLYKAQGTGEMVGVGDSTFEKWRCGIEVELSLKSPERYIRQFKDLTPQVYDSWDKVQHYPMLIFFYSTPTLHDALAKQLKSGLHNFGGCVFFLIQIDEFLKRLGNTSVEKFIGSQNKTVTASEMAEARMVTQ